MADVDELMARIAELDRQALELIEHERESTRILADRSRELADKNTELERVQGVLVVALEAAGEELAAMRASIGYRGNTLNVMQEVQDALAAAQKQPAGDQK